MVISVLSVVAGAVLFCLVAVDVFATVFVIGQGAGPQSRRLASKTWLLALRLHTPRRRSVTSPAPARRSVHPVRCGHDLGRRTHRRLVADLRADLLRGWKIRGHGGPPDLRGEDDRRPWPEPGGSQRPGRTVGPGGLPRRIVRRRDRLARVGIRAAGPGRRRPQALRCRPHQHTRQLRRLDARNGRRRRRGRRDHVASGNPDGLDRGHCGTAPFLSRAVLLPQQ